MGTGGVTGGGAGVGGNTGARMRKLIRGGANTEAVASAMDEAVNELHDEMRLLHEDSTGGGTRLYPRTNVGSYQDLANAIEGLRDRIAPGISVGSLSPGMARRMTQAAKLVRDKMIPQLQALGNLRTPGAMRASVGRSLDKKFGRLDDMFQELQYFGDHFRVSGGLPRTGANPGRWGK